MLMLNEVSKNAVSVINGLFKAMIGQVTKILDNLEQKSKNSRHSIKFSIDGYFENHQI